MSVSKDAESSIFMDLNRSKETGNMIAIWSDWLKKGICITAVEDIQPVEIMDDQMVIIKKFDIRGDHILNFQIPLSEIEKVISLDTAYNKYIFTGTTDDYTEDLHVSMRKFQQLINADDLEIIFIRNIESGRKIKVKQYSTEKIIDCYIKEYIPEKEIIVFCCDLSSRKLKTVLLSDIEEIEFDSYFTHKGISSKVFKIQSF